MMHHPLQRLLYVLGIRHYVARLRYRLNAKFAIYFLEKMADGPIKTVLVIVSTDKQRIRCISLHVKDKRATIPGLTERLLGRLTNELNLLSGKLCRLLKSVSAYIIIIRHLNIHQIIGADDAVRNACRLAPFYYTRN